MFVRFERKFRVHLDQLPLCWSAGSRSQTHPLASAIVKVPSLADAQLRLAHGQHWLDTGRQEEKNGQGMALHLLDQQGVPASDLKLKLQAQTAPLTMPLAPSDTPQGVSTGQESPSFWALKTTFPFVPPALGEADASFAS